jgi:hypothetical protein
MLMYYLWQDLNKVINNPYTDYEYTNLGIVFIEKQALP